MSTLSRMKLQKRATTLSSFTRVPKLSRTTSTHSTLNTQRHVIIDVFNLIISLPIGGISNS
ncbi:uncharacterized protein Bfra_005142 [Botrytis fragariae]|uniref:Uncharacterized protein n=1 Tax=Botrytis fragariae TaxID=1964551 RepID=A0A8H6EIN9_9HELO|nr:uncharacterized protein Bfra_005142 [Botrytis fragariae]KAF5873678.1 hypothetical protein Bfra_005142 [Botrytis fragariae]